MKLITKRKCIELFLNVAIRLCVEQYSIKREKKNLFSKGKFDGLPLLYITFGSVYLKIGLRLIQIYVIRESVTERDEIVFFTVRIIPRNMMKQLRFDTVFRRLNFFLNGLGVECLRFYVFQM